MKSAGEIATQALRGVTSASHGSQPTPADSSGSRAAVIDELWDRMAAIFGRQRWVAQYGEFDRTGDWERALAGLSGAELARGFEHCATTALRFLPSAGEFRAFCRPPKAQRENEAMYRFPPSRQLPHLLSERERATGRAAIAAMREKLG